jgi:hypothetical protein
LAENIAWRRVVADRVLVQVGRLAANSHSGATINGDAANLGGALPEYLREVTDVVENIIGNVGSTKVWQHGLELALVPALGDTSSDIENIARGSEEVLSLVGSRRDIMLKLASVGSLGSGLSNRIVPNQSTSAVVGAGSVVVVENRSLILGSNGKGGLRWAGDMIICSNS